MDRSEMVQTRYTWVNKTTLHLTGDYTMTDEQYQHLGIFGDWVAAARTQRNLYPPAPPGPETQRNVRAVLGFTNGPEEPQAVQIDRTWEHDGLRGEALSWSVGYGPRTAAWLLKPADAVGPLPAVVALHDHGGFKYLGKEKIARGPEAPPAFLEHYYWPHYYGGRAYPNALAQAGFAVLVPDTFLWGSRRFPQDLMPAWSDEAFNGMDQDWAKNGIPEAIARYNFAAAQHEHVVEKYCRQLGTTLAGVVSHEDRIAVNYLRTRDDIDATRIGAMGLSGGGARTGLLQATCDHIRAAVVVGMMASQAHLLDQHIQCHTWMFWPDGWARQGDWPDLVACRAPSPLLVQYDLEDDLFSVKSMKAADERLKQHYASVGQPDAYTGEFYPGPHKFDREMQASAFAWLKQQLAVS
jgi:dienelactone hydrolase